MQNIYFCKQKEDLLKKVRHQFSNKATSHFVSLHEFNQAFGKVFTGVSSDKFQQIFDEFDTNSTGTINYFELLKSESLPKILLSFHNESTIFSKNLKQMSIIQQQSSVLSDTIGGTSTDTDNDTPSIYKTNASSVDGNTTDNGIMPIFPARASSSGKYRAGGSFSLSNPHSKQSSLEMRQSLGIVNMHNMRPQVSVEESITSLQDEVTEKEEENKKLRQWIELKGLPAQKSTILLQEKVVTVEKREKEMANEIQQIHVINKSLKSTNESLQKQLHETESRLSTITNEHKSVKTMMQDLQRAYDDCLNKYDTEKKKRQDLGDIIKDLRKLKDQYEQVNNDQGKKIEAYKEDVNDLREKVATLEFACQEMQQENEVLAYYAQNAANFDPQNDEDTFDQNDLKPNLPPAASSARPRSARNRALSAVNEDEENQSTHAPDFTRHVTEPVSGDHPRFQRSTSFNISTLDDLTKKFHHISHSQQSSFGGGKRHSLLNRIRSATQHSAQFSINIGPQTPVLVNHDSMVSSQGGWTPSIDYKGNNPYAHAAQESSASNYGFHHNMADSMNDVNTPKTPLDLVDGGSNYSTMYGGRRRTRGVSILRIGTPRKRTLASGAFGVCNSCHCEFCAQVNSLQATYYLLYVAVMTLYKFKLRACFLISI